MILTINALACADSVLIPVQAEKPAAKGVVQLLKSILKVKKHINSKLTIEGILPTMVDGRLNFQKYSFYLSHYQTKTASLETRPEHALYNINGHIHTKDKFFQDNPYFYNVSCDSQNCMPVKAEDMIADIENEVKKCIELLDV